jgi:peptide subunit release factor 1 (eRF1)
MRNEVRGTLLDDGHYDSTVHHLVGYHSDEGVLTVYLDIDPATAGREGYEAVLMDLWKPLHAKPFDQWTRGRMEYEMAGITDEVRSWEQAPGRAVAMFFSGPGGLRIVIPLQFPMRSMARFEPRPVLRPLIAALDEHSRYCVLMFDKDHARIITVVLGTVEEEVTLHGDVIGRSAVGGWAQASYARHREHHLHEHARRTIEHVWAIDRSRPIHALVLAGPDEALAVLRRMLPAALARSVVATMPMEMFCVAADVVKRVAEIEVAARETKGRELIAELVEESESGGHASTGWEDTLRALGEGRVQMLVLAEGKARAGVQCPEGHFLSLAQITCCPLCGEPLWQTEDIAENAVRAAMATDAEVHFLTPKAGDELGERGIAAFLRY